MTCRRRIPLLALIGVLAVTGCARKESAGTATSATSPSASSMSMSPMTKPLAGAELDRAFIEGMVPHHQAAVDMAKVELEKGKDQRVKALAQIVVDDQQREIAEMTATAKEKFQFTPAMHMSGPMGEMMGIPMSMDMAKMGQELAGAPNTDQAFLAMMIPHHASAIVMAHEESRNGGDPGLKKLAASIIAAQAKEIGEMQALLASGI